MLMCKPIFKQKLKIAIFHSFTEYEILNIDEIFHGIDTEFNWKKVLQD